MDISFQTFFPHQNKDRKRDSRSEKGRTTRQRTDIPLHPSASSRFTFAVVCDNNYLQITIQFLTVVFSKIEKWQFARHLTSFSAMALVKLLTHTPEPEKVVAIAARLCYSKFTVDEIVKTITRDEVAKSIKLLNAVRHESPIEHASFTFSIAGVSRACLAQITRHRMASYSVKSQRYVNEKKFHYVTPPPMKNDEEFKALMDRLHKHYVSMKSKGYENEDARFLLPNACDTQLIMTMNARSLKNFFTLRCCYRAQWEIRDVANKMLKEVKAVAPLLFKKAGPNCFRGPCTEGKMGENCPMKPKKTGKK
jgi:thymidylate synthase (FAD)